MAAQKPPLKTRWDELALFGGEPAFPNPLHVGRPALPPKEEFLEQIDRIWDSALLTNNGPLVQKLEEKFCELAGTRHAVAVCNATLGLQLVARALGLEGEVILPSFTFIATAHAMRWEGLRPVFCDVDSQTHTLDPRRVEELVGEETSAILGVHLWGNACATDALQEIAQSNGLHLFLDAAHGLGCSAPCGRPIGGFGEAEVFSLHATKIVSGFEGGMVTTDSDVLAHQLRSLRNFGFAGYDDVRGLGTNAKMSEVSAAMALCGIEQLGARIEHNREIAAAYEAHELPGIEFYAPTHPEGSSRQYVVARVDESKTGFSRDILCEALWAEGIRARRYFTPGCHRSDPYRWECRDAADRLPVTEKLCEETLVLPTGASLSSQDVEAVCSVLRTCLDYSRRLADWQLSKAA